MSSKNNKEGSSSSPPTKKVKKGTTNDDDYKPFASLSAKSGYPMAHTMRLVDENTGMDCIAFKPRSKFEMIMMAIGGTIREKQEWWIKVKNEKIVQKWRDEICNASHLIDPKLPYYVRSNKQKLPQTFKYYVMDIIDDGDVNYTVPREHVEEDDDLYYDSSETEDVVDKLRDEFKDHHVDVVDSDSNTDAAKLEEVLYTKYQVKADQDGYLITNPNHNPPTSEGAAEGTDDETNEEENAKDGEEDSKEAPDQDEDEKTQQKILLGLFDYALKECQWMASKFQNGPSYPAAVQGVYCRDDLATTKQDLYKNLLLEIGKLREKPAIGHSQEDRHPGTPALVDLVHPSLYCYERGKTPVLANVGSEALVAPSWDDFLVGGDGNESTLTMVEQASNESDDDHNHSFESQQGLQWLPSEFVVDSTTNQCHINSYINNLHPKEYDTLYHYIGELFVHCLPLLEDTLNDKAILEPPASRIDATFTDLDDDNDDDDYDKDKDLAWKKMYKTLDAIPEIPEFEPYDNSKKDKDTEQTTTTSLKDRPLQVIVKIASLELTPDEHPTNPVGSWHVEGCLDERIVATACCYLETNNIQEGSGDLQFRIAVSNPYPQQGDWFGVEAEYDISDGETLVQPRGSCATATKVPGRVLAWSNIWQHRVDTIKLADPTQPGKRTILCFFLVDPTLRIRSTATVPPQQKDWLYSYPYPPPEQQQQQSVLVQKSELSELVAADNKVATNVVAASNSMGCCGIMTYHEACERRKRLIDERSDFQTKAEEQGDEDFMYGRGFSLCEH